VKFKGFHSDDPYLLWDRELREAALDVLDDYDLWEIWNAPKVVDLVCEHYGVVSLWEDTDGRDYGDIERDQLLAIPGVRDAVFRDIVAGGAADDRLERDRERALDAELDDRPTHRRFQQ
jgi:hypothetical protein